MQRYFYTHHTRIENLLQIKKKLKLFEKANNIYKFEDYYKQSLRDLYGSIGTYGMKFFDGKVLKLLKYYYPNKKIYFWLFKGAPKNSWSIKQNRIAYIHWLEKQLKLKKLEDWYKINKRKEFRKYNAEVLLGPQKTYSTTIFDLLKEAYPKFKWKFWLFHKVGANLWKSKKNQKKFLDWVLKEESMSVHDDSIYKLTFKIINKHKQGATLQKLYGTNTDFIMEHYPSLDRFKFQQKGSGFWKKKKNQKAFLIYLGKKLRFKKKNDWYGLIAKDVILFGGRTLLDYYKQSPAKIVITLLKEYKFDKIKFDFSSKYEFRARCFAQCLFGKILHNKPFKNFRYKKSDQLMQFDVIVPKLNLVIEYNGSQHYFQKYQSKKDFLKRKRLDKEKIQICKNKNILLIIIKYSKWDGLPESYLKIIEKNIKLSKHQKILFWQRLKKDDVYKDILKEQS